MPEQYYSKEEISIALDAIGDAIENRKIAKQPRDRGLDLIKAMLKRMERGE